MGEFLAFCGVVAVVLWMASMQSQVSRQDRRGSILRNRVRFLEYKLLTKEQLNESRSDNVHDEWH